MTLDESDKIMIGTEEILKIYIGTELVYDGIKDEYDQTQVYDINNIATEFVE